MPQFRNFQAAIVVDGIELPEYAIQVSEKNDEISCYIPSEVGKSFAVTWKDFDRQRNTIGKVRLDSTRVGGKRTARHSREGEFSYYRITREIVRPFCFAHLSLTDDENCANSADKLGEIRLQMYPVLHYSNIPYPSDWKISRVPGDMDIHERSKKAMTHCVRYGDDTRKVGGNMMSDVVKGKRLATFVFRYRALDMLQAQGISPPPPRPQPAPPIKREKKRTRCKEEIEIADNSEADEARLQMLKAEIGEIESRHLKRRRTEVKKEEKLPVIEVIELE